MYKRCALEASDDMYTPGWTNQTNRVRQQVARFGRSRATWRQRQRVGAGGCVMWRQRPPEVAANRWAIFHFVHPGVHV